MKRFLTTGNNLFFKARVLSRATVHTLTFKDKITFLAQDGEALRMFEDKLHISHSKLEKTLDSIIDTKINFWSNELNSIKLLWEQNKASEAIRKCDALIQQMEAALVVSTAQAGRILCKAYILKANSLRTGALEKQAQEAFAYYRKALEIMPDNQAAKDGIEILRIIRGESTKTIVEEPDPETSYFKY